MMTMREQQLLYYLQGQEEDEQGLAYQLVG